MNQTTEVSGQAAALAALEADLESSVAADRRRMDALIPAALECADADEIAATRRLLGQFTDEQLWDLGLALMAISVGRDDPMPGRSTPGVRITSNGSRLSAVTGGVA